MVHQQHHQQIDRGREAQRVGGNPSIFSLTKNFLPEAQNLRLRNEYQFGENLGAKLTF